MITKAPERWRSKIWKTALEREGDSQNLIFDVVFHWFAHFNYVSLSEWDDVVVFPQTWEFPLRKRVSYLVMLYLCSCFWSLQIDLQKSSLYQLVCIWVSLEFPCTDKEACLAAKLLKYNFLTQWVLVFFDVWSGGASFNAVNRRLLSRGFFYLTFDWSFQAEL